jgi:hypothetical protein
MSVTDHDTAWAKTRAVRFGFGSKKDGEGTLNPLFCQLAETFSLQLISRFLREAFRASKASRTASHSSASCLNLWNSNDRDSRC